VVSFATHIVLLVLFLLVGPAGSARSQPDAAEVIDGEQMLAEAQQSLPREEFLAFEPDPSGLSDSGEVANDSQRKDKLTVPGLDHPEARVGSRDGSDANPPISYPNPPGFGSGSGPGDIGLIPAPAFGPGGGSGPAGPNPFAYRLRQGDSGSSIDTQRRGGSPASEAAVSRGLLWLQRQQAADGRWLLDGMFKDRGTPNDTAATGLGLLPFLGAGKTSKPSANNPFDKTVARGLRYLINHQDPRRGELGGGMYGHGIATIALCEAYGLTQDPQLRLAAQRAVNYIVYAQHEKGGWRYAPGQEGDLSVTGWQVMALKSAQLAGLDVSSAALKKADRYLDTVLSTSEGYGYTDTNATPTMSAVGLLCREFMHGWGPQNPRLIKGINANLKPVRPGSKKDAYYHYYATQVMYHFGGDAWKTWNQEMRDFLVKGQESDKDSPNFGSWSSLGDTYGSAGGRLMVTSLNLLTLEVYYRYLPLYQRDVAAK
jgi:hypothetical protein